MPRVQSTEDFLSSIDPALIQYAGLLITKGFSNTRLLAHLTFQDVLELPVGHRRLLINEVTKIRSPHSKALLTSLDVNNMQSDGSSGTGVVQALLQPKELFPQTPAKPKDPLIESYTYMTPMQKHLKTLQREVEDKEGAMDLIRGQIESLITLQINDEPDSRPHCSICHEVGHRRNRCSGQKCPASISCGKLNLHKNELKQVDGLRAQLKKMVKDKMALDGEVEKVSDAISQNNKSFAQAVRGYLINSNKHKYLSTYAGQVVPLTKVINIDISILQKHYKNRVPDNIEDESELFQNILDTHQQQLHFTKANTSLDSKLRQSILQVEQRIAPQQTVHPPGYHAPSSPFVQYDHPSVANMSAQPMSFQSSHLTRPQIEPIPSQMKARFSSNGNALARPNSTSADRFYNDVLDLSQHFDALQSPPKKIVRIHPPAETPYSNRSTKPISINSNMSTTYPPNPPIPTTVPSQPWHTPKEALNFSFMTMPGETDHNPLTTAGPAQTLSSNAVAHTVVPVSDKHLSNQRPGTPTPVDYTVVYDQFNIKPKKALADRYSSETGTQTILNEPELD